MILTAMEQTFALSSDLVMGGVHLQIKPDLRKPQKCYTSKILSQIGDGGDMEMMYEEAIYIIVEVDISCS